MLKGSTIACGLAAVALAASAQAALVTFDLRAVSGGTISADKKTVTPAGSSATVTMNLYAVLVNADGNVANDGFQAVSGSFVSSKINGAASGTLVGGNLAPFNDGTASSAGTAAELSNPADGVMDVGSLATSGTAGWFVASSGGAPQMGAAEFLIGTVTANLSGLSGETDVNFVLRQKMDGTPAAKNTVVFTADGLAASRTGYSTDVAVGSPVKIGIVPEPASLSLLGIGALGLLARRRQA